jgi:hypothetical protein
MKRWITEVMSSSNLSTPVVNLKEEEEEEAVGVEKKTVMIEQWMDRSVMSPSPTTPPIQSPPSSARRIQSPAPSVQSSVESVQSVVGLDLCPSNSICRLYSAVFGQTETSMESILHSVTIDDLRNMPHRALIFLQEGVGEGIMEDGDPCWMQLYVMLLLKGIDIMDTAVVPSNQLRISNKIARAVTISRDVSIPTARIGSAVEWVGVGALLAIVCVAIAHFILETMRYQK